MLLGIFLAVYITVALVNYSLVQSLIGSWASSYLSREMKAEIHIGSMGINPLSHVRLHNVLVVDPKGDTVLQCGRITLSFDEFPVSSDGLKLRRVALYDGCYFFETTEQGNNLKFIVDYFKSEKKKKKKAGGEFVVRANTLALTNMRYRMQLKNYQDFKYEYGVNVKDMDFGQMRLRARNVRVLNDNVTLKLESLSAKEKSGLELRNFSGFVYVTPYGISVTDMDVETADSHIMGDVLLHYNGWGSMSEYINNVHMIADIKPGSVGSLRDAAYWAPILWPMEQKINFSGLFYGPVADLHAENVDMSFGSMTNFKLNGYITGLVDIDNTIINGEVTDLTTCIEDLVNVRHPYHSRKIALPQQLAYLSPITIDTATFVGTVDEFMATAQIHTEAGSIFADGLLEKDNNTGEYQYMGSLKSDNFRIKHLLPNDYVSAAGFDITLQGSGFDPDSIQTSANAILHNVVMHGEKIDFVEVKAEMNGKNVEADIDVQDPLADIALSADINLSKPQNEYSLNANITTLDLSRLKLVKNSDSVVRYSGQIIADIHGNSLDELVGSVMMGNTTVKLGRRTIHLDEVSLLARSMDDFKNLTLDCDMLHFVAKGYFNYSDIGHVAMDFCNKYVPVYYNPFYVQEPDTSKSHITDFSFELHYTDSNNVLGTIVPGLLLAHGTTLSGSYSDMESLRLWLKTDSVRYGSLVVSDIDVGGRDVGERFRILANADRLDYGNSFTMRNMSVSMESRSTDAALNVKWDDKEKLPTDGDILINLQSTPERNVVTVLNSSFDVAGQQWDILKNNHVEFGADKFCVEGLQLRSQEQSLEIYGEVTSGFTDELNFDFNSFDIGLFNIFLDDIGINMDGRMTGNLRVLDFHKTLYYATKMEIKDWKLNGRDMGDADLLSRWFAEEKRIHVELSSVYRKGADSTEYRPVTMECFYYPEKDGKLEGKASFNGFDLESVAPYLSSFSSQFDGDLHGDFQIEGKLSQPKITGMAIIDGGLIKVDMFNTVYRFSDTINLEENKILFRDFEFADTRNNKARVDGMVRHNHFKDFVVDLSVASDNIMVMNTTSKDNDYYYGTLFGRVDGTVKGPVKNISVVANASTNLGSTFSIPINNKQEISEQSFVRFVNRDRNVTRTRTRNTSNSMRYKVIVNIAANPNVRLSLPMDFSQISAKVDATGSGDLQLKIASGSDMQLSGNYIIQSGSGQSGTGSKFKINIADLMSRELRLEDGSSLTWSGNPTEANIDIRGVYSQRVNLSSLYSDQPSEQTQKSVTVESIIALSGQLLNPTIKFDFRLPNADQSTEEEVFARIDRTNEREMMNQTISLLAMSQFYSESPNAGSFNAISSGIGIAANTVSSLVSNMVEFVNVNINYKSGDELVNDQLDIGISKEWNRFYFETTFGIGGDARSLDQLDNDDGTANNIIGDVLIGYKITPNFHLVAFNRSNANDYTKQDLPYTQGIGIKYSKDFDTWKSLFAPKKKKKAATTKQKEKKK